MKSTRPGPTHEVGTIRIVIQERLPSQWVAWAEKYQEKSMGRDGTDWRYWWNIIGSGSMVAESEEDALAAIRRTLDAYVYVPDEPKYYPYP